MWDTFAVFHLFATLWVILGILQPGRSTEMIVVDTWPKLVDALHTPLTRHVMIKPGHWAATEQQTPPVIAKLTGKDRTVVLEGQGYDQVYIMGNQLPGKVVVSNGARLIQRNIWLDHCLVSTPPYTCLSDIQGPGSRLEMYDMQLSDASCVRVKDSYGISAMLWSAGMNQTQLVNMTHVDDRTLLIRDSGWLPLGNPDSFWRATNVNLTCTGKSRDPPIKTPGDFETQSLALLAALLWTVACMIVSAFAVKPFWKRYRARCDVGVFVLPPELPEQQLATSMGYVLLNHVSQGLQGRVFKAQHLTSGLVVATKVISFKPGAKKELASIQSECDVLRNMAHPNCVALIQHYTGKIQEKMNTREVTPGQIYLQNSNQYVVQEDLIDGDCLCHDSGSSLDGQDQILCTQLRQIHMVMEYCDGGTLGEFVGSGRLMLADNTPNMPVITRLALDIAKGLAYLHDPTRRVVHCDLSPSNILLCKSTTDPKGFTAKLSDFGLSVVISSDFLYRTAGSKGTVTYMPPEMFEEDCVSVQLDIYSIGVILYFMVVGQDPYPSARPVNIIKSKLAGSQKEFQLQGAIADKVPQEYQDLIIHCTCKNRRNRPSAAEVVAELNFLVHKRPM